MPNTGLSQGEVNYSKRTKYEQLRSQLEIEKSSFKVHWRDLTDFITPRRGRFFTADSNRGDRRNQKIIDSTATLAVRTLKAGMMSGITSPARPWFRLSVPNPQLAESESVKQWLHIVGQRMNAVFLKSNLYNVLPTVYGDMGTYGTAAMLMEEDEANVIRFYSFPIGSYMIANNKNLKVDVFMREFRMTVRQVVDRFGVDPENPGKINWENITTKVKSLWESKNSEAWVDVVHCIKPNEDYDPNKLESKFKKYISVYYEQGVSGQLTAQGFYNSGSEADKFLSEKGYDFFPVLCPRWEITGEDVYGTDCPGMTVLGDVKQLQTGEKRGLQAIEKMINPPMIGPTSLKTNNASILPGDITYLDERTGMQGFRPAHEVRFDINALEAKQEMVRKRISRGFFEDLFLMLAQDDRSNITATEINEKKEEKLLALGPVLEQLNQDLLDPLIDNTFNIMMEADMFPTPPDEIQGMSLKVDYISIMAQAQKLVGLGGIERFTNYVTGIAQLDAAILDKVIGDELVDSYADITSIPPGIVRSDEDVAVIRQQKAQAAAQQAKAEQGQMAARAAKDLSQADPNGDNALNAMLQGGGGV